jgi:hypothetical protein
MSHIHCQTYKQPVGLPTTEGRGQVGLGAFRQRGYSEFITIDRQKHIGFIADGNKRILNLWEYGSRRQNAGQ